MFIRLKYLRKTNNIKIKDISEKLKIPESVYLDYENGNIEIPIIILSKLARFYNTSIDYIVEETDEITPHPKTT